MKRIVTICVLLSLILTGCASTSKKEVKKLKWAVFDLYVEMKSYQKSLNEALEKKGLPYEIEFVNIPANFEGDYKACAYSYLDEVKNGDYDIITCPDSLSGYDLYTIMADEEIFMPITDFLEKDGIGKQLKEAYPSVVWEAMNYKGEIYGILTPDTRIKYYAVFNGKYTDKYGIDVSQMTFDKLEESLRLVCNGERRGEEEPFTVSTGWPSFPGGTFEFSSCELICIDRAGDKPIAENILYEEAFLEHAKKLGDWGREGLLTENGWKAVREGEFFVTGTYSYSSEAAECICRKTSGIPADVKLQVVELPEFNTAFYRRGGKTGIKKDHADFEETFEVLAAVYSDEDLSNALAHGRENVDFQVEDGKAVRKGGDWLTESNMKSCLGNPFLTMPGSLDSVSKKEELWNLVESMPLAVREKVSFDIEEIDQELCRLNILALDKYGQYFMGLKDIETALENIRKDAEEAGIEKVLSEMNGQLGWDR